MRGKAFKTTFDGFAEWRAVAPWVTDALGAQEVLKQATMSGEDPVATKVAVAEHLGVSVPLVSRYLAVVERLQRIEQIEGVPFERLISPVFNSIEAAVRLYERDRQQGLLVLDGLRTRQLKLSDVRERLARASAKSTSEKHGSETLEGRVAHEETLLAMLPPSALRRQQMLNGLRRNLMKISGAAAAIAPRSRTPRFPYWGFDVSIGLDDQAADSIEIYDVALKNPDRIEARVMASLAYATFWRRFYIAIAPGADLGLALAVNQILQDVGNTASIGLLQFEQDATVEIVRKPHGLPVPDRRSAGHRYHDAAPYLIDP
jgi:hypothetical protein